jgi:ribosomal protein S21
MQRRPLGALALLLRTTLARSQQTRGLIVVDVKNNNVDQANGKVQRQSKESGLVDELRKREHHRTPHDMKHEQQRQAYNKRMGYIIQARLRWIARRRKGM